MSNSPDLTPADLQKLLDFSIKLARTAGALILEGSKAILAQRAVLSTGSGVNEKKNAVDLVTEWDVRVENLVREEISKSYPGFGFIGEESYSSGDRPALTNEPTFCVDPIDGTTNFVHGFPHSCISIGLIYKKAPVIGVIYNPFLDQLYHGLANQGSYLISPLHPNPLRLPLSAPSPLTSLSQAMIGIEWGSDRSKAIIEAKARSFVRLAGDGKDVPGGKMAHSLRSLGSAALNYAAVASGGLDMYWEIGCWPWDVCAGVVIAQEAGGFIAGSPTSSSVHNGLVTEEVLAGRKYLVVRAIADTPEESGRDAQRRIVREFYETVEDWDTT